MTKVSPSLSVITLNVNGFNSSVKGKLIEQIEKWSTAYKKLTLDLKIQIDRKSLNEENFHANSKQKRAGVAMVISQVDFRSNIVTRDKDITLHIDERVDSLGM